MVHDIGKTESQSVLFRREGRLARITLNRPRALNALNLAVIMSITEALDGWETDPGVEVVVLDGAGERGFCAGGDLTTVHVSALGDPAVARRLWRHEYRLDAKLARYPKPVVSFMDGVVMGGGVGLTAHRPLRLVTERTVLALPEVAIGLAPDVGGCLLLSRAPGELGTYLALTSARVGPAEAIACGLADQLVPSQRLPAILDKLREGRDISAEFTRPAPAPAASWIDSCFAADDVEGIVDRLQRRPEPEAATAAETLLAAAPTALKVTLRALRQARELGSLEQCLVQDYRRSCRFLDGADLAEGIRAVIIDKDRLPRWRPATLAGVREADVDAYFASLGGDELRLPSLPTADGLWSDHTSE